MQPLVGRCGVALQSVEVPMSARPSVVKQRH